MILEKRFDIPGRESWVWILDIAILRDRQSSENTDKILDMYLESRKPEGIKILKSSERESHETPCKLLYVDIERKEMQELEPFDDKVWEMRRTATETWAPRLEKGVSDRSVRCCWKEKIQHLKVKHEVQTKPKGRMREATVLTRAIGWSKGIPDWRVPERLGEELKTQKLETSFKEIDCKGPEKWRIAGGSWEVRRVLF